MYEELIQKLRNAGKESFLFSDLMREAADAIEELRAKADLYKEVVEEYRMVNMMLIDKFPQWIPVTERLPKEEETVLTWGKENKCILLDWMHDNKWCCFWDADYWMPLPEPPDHIGEANEMVEKESES